MPVFVLTFHPALVVEPANIATETFYIFFLMMGLWLYLEYVVDSALSGAESRFSTSFWIVLVAIALALGTLTRAVLLLFPVGIVIHMLYDWLAG